MDIRFDFTILGVPNEAEVDRITRGIERVLEEDFHTDVSIIPEVL